MGRRYNQLYSLARFLSKELLPGVVVHVHRDKMPNDIWGYCTKKGKEFDIRVDRRMSEHYALFILMHEFSHAVSWSVKENDHGWAWGEAMSQVYCAYLKWAGCEERRAACHKKIC